MRFSSYVLALVIGGFSLAALPTAFSAWNPVQKSPLESLKATEWNELSHNASGWERGGDIAMPENNIFLNTSGGVGIGTASISTGLHLDVEGSIGASLYCDENGQNCKSIFQMTGGTGSALSPSVGGGIQIAGDNIGLVSSCATGEILKYDTINGWECSSDNAGSGGTDLSGFGCQSGEILSFDGSAWGCVAQNTSPWTPVAAGIFTADNVGIGTFTPGAKLHVVGNIIASDPTDATHVATRAYVDGQISAGGGAQTLSLTGNTLSLTDGGFVDLSSFLDNTNLTDADITAMGYVKTNTNTQLSEAEVDAFVANNGYLTAEGDANPTNEIQTLSLSGSTLSLTGSTDVDLSGLGGDGIGSDDQFIALTGNTLSIEGGNSVNLSSYLDNTDTILSDGDIAAMGYLKVDTNTQLDETAVDAFVANNGYLTSFTEADGNATNEIQDLDLSGNILTITNNGFPTDIDLSPYLDNTDIQALSLSGTTLSLTNSPNVDLSGLGGDGIGTDDQQLALTGNTLSIETGNNVDLSGYLPLDETAVDAFVANNSYLTAEVDASVLNEIQDLDLSGNILTITNNGFPTDIDLSGYLDDTTLSDTDIALMGYIKTDTDDQTLGLSGSTLSIIDGNSVDLAPIISAAGSDNQDLSLAGDTLSLTNDVTPVDLAKYLDDTDTQLTEAEVDAFVANNGYISNFSETDTLQTVTDRGSTTTNALTIKGLSADTNTLHVDSVNHRVGIGTTAPSAKLHVFGDAFFNGKITSDSTLATDAGTIVTTKDYVDAEIAAGADGTGTDDQNLTLLGNTLAIENGNSVDLAAFAGSDDQALSLATNTLSLENGGSVDLSSYLDNTNLDETAVDAFVANNGYLTSFTEVDGSVTNEIQDLDLTANTLTITNNGFATDIDLSTYLDNTDAQALSLSGNTLSLTNSPDVDLSGLGGDGTGTDDQTLSFLGTTLSIETGNSIDLAALQDGTGTDDQALSLATNTLSLENGGSVDLSSYLDNTDSQTLSLATNTLSLANGGSVNLAGYLDNTDTQLTELQVDTYVGNNGYLTSYTETDTLADVVARGSNADTGTFYIDTLNNRVGIGSILPSEKLEVNGDILADAFLYSSDERLKKNIEHLSYDSLGSLLAVRAVEFQWKENGKNDTGFIAQDLEKYFPEFVQTNSHTGYKTVEYSKIVVPLVHALQQMDAKYETELRMLYERIEELEGEIKN